MKKMKLKWMLMTLLSCCFLFFACGKDDNTAPAPAPGEEAATLSVAPETGLEFDAEEGMKTVVVTTNQMTWSATLETANDTTWCRLSQASNILTVRVLANDNNEPRSGKIKVVAGSGDNTAVKEITVGQSLPAATLVLEPNSGLEFSGLESQKTVTVTTNRSTWTASLKNTNDDNWCTLSQEGNILTVKVSKNTTAERTATVIVTAGTGDTGKSLEFDVKQSAFVEDGQTYSVYQLYDKNGIKGIVYEISDGGKHGKIISLDKYVGLFLSKGDLMFVNPRATSYTDGRANTALLKKCSSYPYYPAVQWVVGKNTESGLTDEEGWYLPAQDEAQAICYLYVKDYKEFNANLKNAGGVEMNDPKWGSYSEKIWTPTDHALGSSTAYVNLNDGLQIWSIGYKCKINDLTDKIGDVKNRDKENLDSGMYTAQDHYWPDMYEFRAVYKF